MTNEHRGDAFRKDTEIAPGRLSKEACLSGSGCTLCLFSWSSPNPVVKNREKVPLLARRAIRAKQCAPCANNVNTNHPAENVTSLQAKLDNGTMKQEEYDLSREK